MQRNNDIECFEFGEAENEVRCAKHRTINKTADKMNGRRAHKTDLNTKIKPLCHLFFTFRELMWHMR